MSHWIAVTGERGELLHAAQNSNLLEVESEQTQRRQNYDGQFNECYYAPPEMLSAEVIAALARWMSARYAMPTGYFRKGLKRQGAWIIAEGCVLL